MAISGSKDIGRNRAPRVQIEYDVPTLGGTKKTELPWVMGVMADLSGNAAEGLDPVGRRKFREINAENFDEQLADAKPKLKFTVPNKLAAEGEEAGELAVELEFKRMEDFSPAALARQVEPLRKLLETRERLSNLLANVDGKDQPESALEAALADPDYLKKLMEMPAAEGGA